MPKSLQSKAGDFLKHRAFDLLSFSVPEWHWTSLLLSHFHFYRRHGRFPDVKHSRDMNDYIFGVKTDPRSTRYVQFVDKVLVKQFVSSLIGVEYIIPTLGVFTAFDDLLAVNFSEPYIVKPTHMSGMAIIKQGGALSRKELKTCQKWLNTSFFSVTREYNYRALTPKIIIEPLMTYRGDLPPDVKLTMGHGKCGFLQYDIGRFGDVRRNLYTPEWEQINARLTAPNIDAVIPKPEGFSEILSIAEIIAAWFDFVRIDFFLTDGGFKFAEITITPGNAGEKFIPVSAGEALWTQLMTPPVEIPSPTVVIPLSPTRVGTELQCV